MRQCDNPPASPEIARCLSAVRTLHRRVRIAEGALLLLLFAAAVVFVAFALDNLLHLGLAARLALTGLFAAGVVGLFALRILPCLLARPTDQAIALLIERSHPALENRLINALQLGVARLDAGGAAFARLLWLDAANFVTRVDTGATVDRRTLRRLARGLPVPLLALLVYALAFPAHFANALARYAHPTRFVPPLSHTLLTVAPGDVTLLKGAELTIRAVCGGELPPGARLVAAGESGTAAHDMVWDGAAFAFAFDNVAAPFTYQVEAGDAESARHTVRVVERPRLVGLALELRYPAYTRLPPRIEDPFPGEIAAVVGARAVLTVRASKPLAAAAAVLESGATLPATLTASDSFTVEIAVAVKDRYRIEMKDAEGIGMTDPPSWPITPLEDRPPTVEIRRPERDLSLAPDAELPVAVRARDDLGVVAVRLAAVREGREGELELGAWEYPGTDREVNTGTTLRLAALALSPGDVLRCLARARDAKGQETASAPFKITIASAREEQAKTVAAAAVLLDRLRQLLEMQRRARADADRLSSRLDRAPAARVAEAAKEITGQQVTLREAALKLVADWVDPQLARVETRDRLAALAAGEMAEVLLPLAAFSAATAPAARAAELAKTIAVQERILAALTALLAESRTLLDELKKGEVEQVVAAREATSTREKLKDALDGVRDFVKAQQKVIEETQELAKKKPDDFSSADKKELADLKATEEKWGKFLQEAGTDLSKLPPQDFSNSSIAKELLEAASEVEQAAQAVDQKKIEMAVPLEQSGLELAKEITANLERWLADAPDNLKWNMEEPTEESDVPMADLPEELEDLVGELIDQEEEMDQDTQDVTSSWMDSLNEGAGWTAMDGPISNMSAKGITGNLQPNSQEVGGRSGEGRSGKSSGQMVEETASGKGGKQTPSRSTPDPFEAGRVQDSSKDATGGSTGGGKVSGVNAEGLRGSPPPPVMEKMDRIKNSQAEIRAKAEKIEAGLEKRHYYSDDLKHAIELMKAMEADLARYQGADYADRRKQIAEKLGALQKVIDATMRADQDTAGRLPKELRDEIRNALDEQAPAEYSELIKDYYRGLSEGR